jgi:hypothetical protein
MPNQRLPVGAGATKLPFTEHRRLPDGRFRRTLRTAALGQLLPFAHPTKRSLKRLIHSETCRMPYGSTSAYTDLQAQVSVRRLRDAFRTLASSQPRMMIM